MHSWVARAILLADGRAIMDAIFLGWILSVMWRLTIFGIALLLVRLLRRRSNAQRTAEAGAR